MNGTTVRTGTHAIIEQFVADGILHMFGNPGTVEQGFLDALGDFPEMKYILTLQESVAVMAADAHARATKRPALVQIHSSPGLGNAIGALYQAKRGHAPLVVIGGDAGVRYLSMDAQMAADLVAVAEPVTKWATCVYHADSLLRVLRRAIKIAGTPPMGPVYVCLPQDILDQPAQEPVRPTFVPSTRVAPHAGLLDRAADLLLAAKRPVIIMGDGIAYSRAQPELARVAELLGAKVWEANNGELNMDALHPLYQGATGHMFGSHSRTILEQGDALLVVGTYLLPEVFPVLDDIVPDGIPVVHFDLDAYEIAKSHRVDIGVVADPKTSLRLFADTLEARTEERHRVAATRRLEASRSAKAKAAEAQREEDARVRDRTPLFMSAFMEQLAPRLPEDAVIFDEALTNSPAIVRHFPPRLPDHYFLTRGGSLGVGFPGAIGLKLAYPDKLVMAFSGDGGCMYTIQSLWSIARHGLDVKLVVCNNLSYRLLQLNIQAYWRDRGEAPHAFPLAFDLSKPRIDFVGLARSMGVDGTRVESPEEIGPAIDRMLGAKGAFLVDLVLENETHPELIGVTCGQ